MLESVVLYPSLATGYHVGQASLAAKRIQVWVIRSIIDYEIRLLQGVLDVRSLNIQVGHGLLGVSGMQSE
jgi:hypothetical protein